jgi:hypothetical protein
MSTLPALRIPTGGELNYESKLTTRFAIDPKCKGIKFVTSGDERSRLIVMQTPRWDLKINYVPGEQNQNWQLFDFPETTSVREALEGDGNEEKIAGDVFCRNQTRCGSKVI